MINETIDLILDANLLKGVVGADLRSIELVEQALGIVFSNDYRFFLQKVGACIYGGHEINGICNYSDIVTVQSPEKM